MITLWRISLLAGWKDLDTSVSKTNLGSMWLRIEVRASYKRENMKVMWVEAHQEYASCLIFGSQPQALDPESGKGLSKTGVL